MFKGMGFLTLAIFSLFASAQASLPEFIPGGQLVRTDRGSYQFTTTLLISDSFLINVQETDELDLGSYSGPQPPHAESLFQLSGPTAEELYEHGMSACMIQGGCRVNVLDNWFDGPGISCTKTWYHRHYCWAFRTQGGHQTLSLYGNHPWP